MSIEMIIRAFSFQKGYTLAEKPSGFEGKRGEREEFFFDSLKDLEQVLFLKSFAGTGVSESSVYVSFSSSKKELLVSVRYGCLRDYISQLSSSDKPLLIDLREKLERQLKKKHLPADWIEETYTDFLRFNIYHLLNKFYP